MIYSDFLIKTIYKYIKKYKLYSKGFNHLKYNTRHKRSDIINRFFDYLNKKYNKAKTITDLYETFDYNRNIRTRFIVIKYKDKIQDYIDYIRKR